MTLFTAPASLCILTLTTITSFAGSNARSEKTVPKNGDWCAWLQDDPGVLYKNKENPYIQEVAIDGRFQWQYGYVDGESGGRKFNYDTEEIRRFRLGAEVKFLQFFELSASFDLADDLAPTGLESDHDIEYADIYSATLTFNAQKAFNIQALDSLKISVGKHKVISNGEYSLSSRHIKTIERSAISNFTTPPSSTGLVISIDKGPWDLDLGVFSGDLEPEFSEFDASNDYFYTLRLGSEIEEMPWFEKSRLDLRLTMNGDESDNSGTNPESPGAYDLDWVGSLAFTGEKDRFNLLADFIYGDNGAESNSRGKPRPEREGSFWSVVILPSYWLVENRLEAVFRYQYTQAQQAHGIRIDSRYVRRAGAVKGLPDVEEGRGDEHHSAYLGLNYYLCEDNAKVMLGVEYDDLGSDGVDIYEGFSAWAAFRMYF
ncbi:MAG: hypothetical protein H7A51_00405 [Akkermansiaceae bacterium]|nr:hypothetical protein [Akkermansiaceae bacterium]